jgi:hypothetical protein
MQSGMDLSHASLGAGQIIANDGRHRRIILFGLTPEIGRFAQGTLAFYQGLNMPEFEQGWATRLKFRPPRQRCLTPRRQEPNTQARWIRRRAMLRPS